MPRLHVTATRQPAPIRACPRPCRPSPGARRPAERAGRAAPERAARRHHLFGPHRAVGRQRCGRAQRRVSAARRGAAWYGWCFGPCSQLRSRGGGYATAWTAQPFPAHRRWLPARGGPPIPKTSRAPVPFYRRRRPAGAVRAGAGGPAAAGGPRGRAAPGGAAGARGRVQGAPVAGGGLGWLNGARYGVLYLGVER